ncbi:MAG: UDP-2,3-diacylglucosamine diphosphatase LpxI [Pseudomonadota bacterium]
MLALITGRGALPGAVARAQDTAPLVCALDGHHPDGLVPDLSFRIEHLGSLVADLKARGVAQVCLCGAITRPAIDAAAIDAATLPLVPVLAGAIAGGEDSALRAVLGIFEEAGLEVRGAHELAPELLPPAGAMTDARPEQTLERDLAAARATLEEQGRADLGQACVVRGGVVIAQEGASGTDAMLAGLVERPGGTPSSDPLFSAFDAVGDMLDSAADWLSGPVAEQRAQGRGGFLFKAPKPDQDRRVDLPTIGPETARAVVAAGLDGIVIEAQGVIVLDQPRVRQILKDAGAYCWVR